MSVILVPCLVALRAEFDRLSPGRDRRADGWIGDAAHQRESSDHNPDETGRTPFEDADNVNEVHAIDIDTDLGGGLDLNTCVEWIRLRHQLGEDDRLQNIIWRGRIASRTWGWAWKPYTGASQHYDHAHFSARYSTAQEADTRPWGIADDRKDDDMPSVSDIWSAQFGRGEQRITAGEALIDAHNDSGKALELVAQMQQEVADLRKALDEIKALLSPPPPA